MCSPAYAAIGTASEEEELFESGVRQQVIQVIASLPAADHSPRTKPKTASTSSVPLASGVAAELNGVEPGARAAASRTSQATSLDSEFNFKHFPPAPVESSTDITSKNSPAVLLPAFVSWGSGSLWISFLLMTVRCTFWRFFFCLQSCFLQLLHSSLSLLLVHVVCLRSHHFVPLYLYEPVSVSESDQRGLKLCAVHVDVPWHFGAIFFKTQDGFLRAWLIQVFFFVDMWLLQRARYQSHLMSGPRRPHSTWQMLTGLCHPQHCLWKPVVTVSMFAV